MNAANPTLGDPHVWLKRQSRWSPFEILFWLAALLPFFLFPTYLTLASQVAIVALFAISVDLVLGYAGIVTLGHAMFFGLGAYAAGIISVHGWGEPLTGLIFAGAFAGLIGFIVSFLIVRVQHLALIMVTLGLGFLTLELANSMSWLTGGADGLRGISTWPIFNQFRFDLWGYTAYSYSLIALFVGFLISRRIVHSSFGLSLRGIRDNVTRLPAIGSDASAMSWSSTVPMTLPASSDSWSRSPVGETSSSLSGVSPRSRRDRSSLNIGFRWLRSVPELMRSREPNL